MRMLSCLPKKQHVFEHQCLGDKRGMLPLSVKAVVNSGGGSIGGPGVGGRTGSAMALRATLSASVSDVKRMLTDVCRSLLRRLVLYAVKTLS